MYKRIPLILIAASTLTGCTFGTPPMPATTAIYLGNVDTDCPPIPSAKTGRLPDLVKNHKQALDLHHKCRDAYRTALERSKLNNPPDAK